METIQNQTFATCIIHLDGKRFVDCTFRACIMIFKAEGEVGMEGCTFDRVQWVFEGAAGTTINFLQAMYHGMGEGGKKLVEDTFNVIKTSPPSPKDV
jgi:hypothetical protein